MLAIRLPNDIEERLNRLTLETGRTKTALAREAILALVAVAKPVPPKAVAAGKAILALKTAAKPVPPRSR